MQSKVFISCGQYSEEEREIAKKLKDLFVARGFCAYVAIAAQSIQDVNSAIIAELRSSDYYVFIDLPRESFKDDPNNLHRGSLFSHQELAIAYMLGFERVLFLQQANIQLEGLLRYMASNAIKFESTEEISGKIEQAITDRGWLPDYTRHLTASNLHWSDGIIIYRSPTGEAFLGRFLYVDINNHRSDIAAYGTVARLKSIVTEDGKQIPISDISHLKVTGQPGYAQTIWPQSHGAFDLLLVSADKTGQVILNSSLDLSPKPAVITNHGRYLLQYEVLSESFPVLTFTIQLETKLDPLAASAALVDI